MTVRPAVPADVPRLTALQASSFETPWSADSLAATVAGHGVHTLAAEAEGGIAGFVIVRTAAGEAEILTLAVDPAQRRRGFGAGLVAAAVETARQASADTVFLEVAIDNPAAIALYEKLGFVTAGRRPAYYPRGRDLRVDALILRCDLTQ